MTAIAETVAILTAEHDRLLVEAGRIGEILATLRPLLNPVDVPAGRPVVIPAPAPAPTATKPVKKVDPAIASGIECPECGRLLKNNLALGIHRSKTHNIRSLDPRIVARNAEKQDGPLLLRCNDCDWTIDPHVAMAGRKLNRHTVADHHRQPDHDERVPRTVKQVA